MSDCTFANDLGRRIVTEESSLQLIVKIWLIQIRRSGNVDLGEQARFGLQTSCILRGQLLLDLNALGDRGMGFWSAVLVNVIVNEHEPDIHLYVLVLKRLQDFVSIKIDCPINALVFVRQIKGLI